MVALDALRQLDTAGLLGTIFYPQNLKAHTVILRRKNLDWKVYKTENY